MANTYFTIAFTRPYTFVEEKDFSTICTETSLPYVHTRVISYTQWQLLIGVQGKGLPEYVVNLNIGPENLVISCNCNKLQTTLCVHAYHALQALCHNNKAFFTMFKPGGLVSMALAHKNIFHTDYTSLTHFIVPDKSLGRLWDTEAIPPIHTLVSLPSAEIIVREKEIVWLLAYRQNRWQQYMPVLVPVTGTLTKTGDTLKSLGKGFSQTNNSILLNTTDCKQLHQLATELFNNSKGYCWEMEALFLADTKLQKQFSYWNQCLPLLTNQPHVYRYILAHPRTYMRQPPMRNYLRKIVISPERPQLQFVLRDKGPYYQLRLQFLVRGIPLKNAQEDALFFVYSNEQYFLLNSYRDVAVMQWMQSCNNTISVMKAGFTQFEKEVLDVLKTLYTVIIK